MDAKITLKQCIARVISLRDTITKEYGVHFFWAKKKGSIHFSMDSARITFPTYSGKAELKDRETGKVIFTLDNLKRLFEEYYPDLDYEEIDTLFEFGVTIYMHPNTYEREAYIQRNDQPPQKIYVWLEDSKKIIYTYGQSFNSSCHYSANKSTLPNDIFDDLQSARKRYKEQLVDQKAMFEEQAIAAQKKAKELESLIEELDGLIEQLNSEE